MKLLRDLIRELIEKISFYAFSKIYNQYKLITKAKKHLIKCVLKTCEKNFVITISLSCTHIIKNALKIDEKKLLFKNVHFY